MAFVSGAGLSTAVHGTVQHGLMHVTDWLPTLVTGAAGIKISKLGRPCPTCNRSIAPLDGVNQWAMLSQGSDTARTEALLKFQVADWDRCTHHGKLPCKYPGSAALRMGKWKLLHGSQGSLGPMSKCVVRSGSGNGKAFPIPVPANESTPVCAFGWTPPPRGDGKYQPPYPPSDAKCTNSTPGQAPTIPCVLVPDSGYIIGQTLLFDVVSDMAEEHNVAAENPDIVTKMMARLQQFNLSYCGGQPCLPDSGKSLPPGKPTKDDTPKTTTPLVWLPWRGDPSPVKCDTDRTNDRPSPKPPTPTPTPPTPPKPTPPTPKPPPAPPSTSLHTNIKKGANIAKSVLFVNGWCWDAAWAGGGVPPMTVRLSVDGKPELNVLANITKPALMNVTGAPNSEHGFKLHEKGQWVDVLGGAGKHRLDLDVFLDPVPSVTGHTAPMKGSPLCFSNGNLVGC